jgi:hypothetical protein
LRLLTHPTRLGFYQVDPPKTLNNLEVLNVARFSGVCFSVY